jgi:hypothetical protein
MSTGDVQEPEETLRQCMSLARLWPWVCSFPGLSEGMKGAHLPQNAFEGPSPVALAM